MTFKLSEAIVDSLLEKLGSDDEFRTLFQANPRQALASLGHQAAASAKDTDAGAWTCMATAPLASKSAIKASHVELRRQLLSAMAVYTPIHLQSS
jgi:putative modified peptide